MLLSAGLPVAFFWAIFSVLWRIGEEFLPTDYADGFCHFRSNVRMLSPPQYMAFIRTEAFFTCNLYLAYSTDRLVFTRNANVNAFCSWSQKKMGEIEPLERFLAFYIPLHKKGCVWTRKCPSERNFSQRDSVDSLFHYDTVMLLQSFEKLYIQAIILGRLPVFFSHILL